jgi:hypothetical protein
VSLREHLIEKRLQLVVFQGVFGSRIYIGDSLTENAYKLFFSDLISFFNLIDEIPQHYYFLNKSAGCWKVTMNGKKLN